MNAVPVPAPELAVTLSDELFHHLSDEAARLGIPLEWLVASMVVDTMDEEEDEDEFDPTLN